MTPIKIHLALNHLPLAGLIFGVLFLFAGLIRRSAGATLSGLWLLCLAALFSVPTFLSGEPSEELVEDKPGFSREAIHEHEEAAELAWVLLLLTGAVAGGSIFIRKSRPKVSGHLSKAALVSAVAALAATGNAARLGGLIRHADELGGLPASVQQHDHSTHEHNEGE